jgi:hypothetical protein
MRSTYQGTGKRTGSATDSRSDRRTAARDGSQRGPASGSYRTTAPGSLLSGSNASASKREHGQKYCR